MEKGWSRRELQNFIKPFTDSDSKIPMSITLVRSESVEQLYGKVDASMQDKKIEEEVKNTKSITIDENYTVTQLTAIKAEQNCLSCHSNAKPGEILGVLKIQQELNPTISGITRKFLLLFLVLSPLPIVLAILVSHYATRKIEKSIVFLHDKIKEINSIKDLRNLTFDNVKTDFIEINQMISEADTLVYKLKDVAVDKDLLEFEVRLLEKFIITSEVVKDWKEHVSKLLIQVNEIMDAYALFSVFQIGYEYYDLEIFWYKRPTEKTRNRIDDIIKQRISEQNQLNFLSAIQVNHNVIDQNAPEIELEEKEINLQIKTIFLKQPQIGGIVGIGVQSDVFGDAGGALVIEGILNTLVNVIGSIKAIYNYTKKLEYYASRDPLTDLYNQRLFWDLASNELYRARRHNNKFAILMLDFDNFKMVNDRYGHAFGDIFLQIFSSKIKEFMREGDILTRYGGDEFAAILPEADQIQAQTAASRIIDSLREVTIDAPDDTKIKATISIGLSVFPDHSEEVNALFMIADNMMYKAKKEGKNRIGTPTREDIVEAFRAKEDQRLFLLNVLENTEQIIPFFQPIMDLHDNSINMQELLMSIHYKNEILTASSFIETAEKMGIISQMDFIVIEKAFKKLHEINYQGLLFINLSPSSLILREYISNMKKMAAEYDINLSNIVFEITERETVKNRALLEKFSHELKSEGFKFAIDDFGSGFSTFHYLKLFPIDFIKIEGEFIKNILKDQTYKAFVKSIISLANDLNIKTVAEHIESEDILEIAKELGADYAQGFFIQRPSQKINI